MAPEMQAELAVDNATIANQGTTIARECLAGDPFREVPELEQQADRLFARYDGTDEDGLSLRPEPLPTYG